MSVSVFSRFSYKKICLLAGVLIPFVFFGSSFVLALFIENYSHLAMTVSEIGRTNSPMQLPWSLTNLFIAFLFCVYGFGVYLFSMEHSLSRIPAYFIIYFGITVAGYAIFEAPHPMHNVIGLSQLLGYMAPMIMAIAWRKQPSVSDIVRWSWYCWILVLIAILLNMAPIIVPQIYSSGYYGLIQRSLFFVFYGAWGARVAWRTYKLNLLESNLET